MMVGFSFLVGLGRGEVVSLGVWLDSGEMVADDEGGFVNGWKGVRVTFIIGVRLEVEEMFIEIRRG
jgi:hypothetical protein